MVAKQEKNPHILSWLNRNFPSGKNYLVAQNDVEQINLYLYDLLIAPENSGRKHVIWGEAAHQLSLIGDKLGWVPNRLQAAFLADTVEMEIAEADAARQKQIQSEEQNLEASRLLLVQFDLLYLAQRNPYFLSEGESKLIWFLTQWAKKPSYFIIGYLPLSLSKKRTNEVVNFLKQAADNDHNKSTIILGYLPAQIDWLNGLLINHNWTTIRSLSADE